MKGQRRRCNGDVAVGTIRFYRHKLHRFPDYSAGHGVTSDLTEQQITDLVSSLSALPYSK